MSAVPQSRRSVLKRGLVTFAALSFAMVFLKADSCSSDKVSGPKDISGTYTLSLVDGQPVPVQFPANTENVTEATSGSLVLAGSDFTLNLVVKQSGSAVPGTSTGTYTRDGRTLNFTGSFGGLTATVPGRLVDGTDNEIQMSVILAGGTHTMLFKK